MPLYLHPEHGVNPTMPVCFWCQKPTGEVALLGRAYRGEAPSHMTLNYNPCPTCEVTFKQGIHLFEAKETPFTENQPPMSNQQMYPSGRCIVLTEEGFKRLAANLFMTPSLGEDICRYRSSAVEPRVFDLILKHTNHVLENKETA